MEAQLTSLESIPEIVARARSAQAAWAALPLYRRVACVAKVRRAALAQAEAVSSLISQETGKPFEEALTAEALSIADLLDHWVACIEPLLETQEIPIDALYFPSKRGRIERAPRGVLALITPWNFPLAIPLRTIIPALMAGNAVVWKPSEHTQGVAQWLASQFEKLLPTGLLQVVQGGPEQAACLIESGVDAVCFTGGAETGRKVAAACAQRLIPCSLELGGKDAAIVLADANVERTARGIVWGAFNNSGQNCASIERVYVERPIAEQFVQRVVQVTRELREGVDFGTMTTRAQFDKARGQLQDAIAGGAEVLCGGVPDGASLAFAPTVVRVTDETSALMTQETFGPVLPIVVVDKGEDAVSKANASSYGLTASIWSRRLSRAQQLAGRLQAGVVTINNHGFTAALPAAPWSGVKDSGWGVTNGQDVLDFLTRPVFVLTDRSKGKRELWWHPYTPTLRRAGLALARFRGGAGLFGRIAAFFALLLHLPKRMLTSR